MSIYSHHSLTAVVISTCAVTVAHDATTQWLDVVSTSVVRVLRLRRVRIKAVTAVFAVSILKGLAVVAATIAAVPIATAVVVV